MNRLEPLNLARRPFVNRRPVVRVALLLWVLGGLALVANGFLYWGFFTGQEEKRSELSRVQAQIESEQNELAKLDRQVRAVDLDNLNEEVDFLNRKIRERTFSWSQLFDQLSRLLPRQVRLAKLSPQSLVPAREEVRRQARRRRKPESEQTVSLGILGQAQTDEALLELIDALFADPAFTDPDLVQESRDDRGLISFTLSVVYHPDRAGRPEPAPAAPSPPAGGPQAGEAVPAGSETSP